MRFQAVVTTMVLLMIVLGCQQDRRVQKNTPRAVFGTTPSGDSGQRSSANAEHRSSSSAHRSGGGQGSRNALNPDVERKRFQNTTQTSRPEEESKQRTQRSQKLNYDLSELESVRERNRRITRKLEESKNEWPEKFDQQAHGKLEEHMQNQGWSNFELEENLEEQTSEDHSSERDNEE